MKLPMKKYIAPEVKNINLYTEETMLLTTSDNVGYGEASNRREAFDNPSASESIWGNGWEE